MEILEWKTRRQRAGRTVANGNKDITISHIRYGPSKRKLTMSNLTLANPSPSEQVAVS
jgi:hypothetical protein